MSKRCLMRVLQAQWSVELMSESNQTNLYPLISFRVSSAEGLSSGLGLIILTTSCFSCSLPNRLATSALMLLLRLISRRIKSFSWQVLNWQWKSIIITPKEQISTLLSYRFDFIQGARQSGVPTPELRQLRSVTESRQPLSIARPKSPTLTSPCLRKMLAGLRSRWMSLEEWMYTRASRTCLMRWRMLFSLLILRESPRFQLQYSMTMQSILQVNQLFFGYLFELLCEQLPDSQRKSLRAYQLQIFSYSYRCYQLLSSSIQLWQYRTIFTWCIRDRFYTSFTVFLAYCRFRQFSGTFLMAQVCRSSLPLARKTWPKPPYPMLLSSQNQSLQRVRPEGRCHANSSYSLTSQCICFQKQKCYWMLRSSCSLFYPYSQLLLRVTVLYDTRGTRGGRIGIVSDCLSRLASFTVSTAELTAQRREWLCKFLMKLMSSGLGIQQDAATVILNQLRVVSMLRSMYELNQRQGV